MSHLRMNLSLATRLENYKKAKMSEHPNFANYIDLMDRGRIGKGRSAHPVVWFNDVKGIDRQGWRWKYADDVIRLNHNGWYADNFQECTFRGIVVRLPARSGENVFLIGYTASDWDSTPICTDEVYNDEEDAAIAADSLAEYSAEEEKKASAKDKAEQDMEQLREDNKTSMTDIHALMTERRNVRKCSGRHSLAVSVLTDRIKTELRQIEKNNARIAAMADNYWLAVPN